MLSFDKFLQSNLKCYFHFKNVLFLISLVQWQNTYTNALGYNSSKSRQYVCNDCIRYKSQGVDLMNNVVQRSCIRNKIRFKYLSHFHLVNLRMTLLTSNIVIIDL